MKVQATTVKALATRTSNAYSYGRFASWAAVAAVLLRRGYTPAEAEAILRSKLTRWAADQSDAPYGRASARDLLRFIDHRPDQVILLFREEGLA